MESDWLNASLRDMVLEFITTDGLSRSEMHAEIMNGNASQGTRTFWDYLYTECLNRRIVADGWS